MGNQWERVKIELILEHELNISKSHEIDFTMRSINITDSTELELLQPIGYHPFV